MMLHHAISNTFLQTVVDEDKRGRVMGLYVMSLRGIVPFGSIMMGGIASKIGAPIALMIGGISCIFGSLLFARKLPLLKKIVAPIYVERGTLRR